jgi:hypothetical protein
MSDYDRLACPIIDRWWCRDKRRSSSVYEFSDILQPPGTGPVHGFSHIQQSPEKGLTMFRVEVSCSCIRFGS